MRPLSTLAVSELKLLMMPPVLTVSNWSIDRKVTSLLTVALVLKRRHELMVRVVRSEMSPVVLMLSTDVPAARPLDE